MATTKFFINLTAFPKIPYFPSRALRLANVAYFDFEPVQVPQMPQVRFTPNLRRFFPDLAPANVDADSVAELMEAIEDLHPGIKAYLLDDQSALREHVNVYVRGELIWDRIHLSDPIGPDDEVYILQALSGG